MYEDSCKQILRRVDQLLAVPDLDAEESEVIRRLREDLDLADGELYLPDYEKKVEFHEQRAKLRPVIAPPIPFRIDDTPTECSSIIPEGSRLLVAWHQGKKFEALSSEERFRADREVPQDFVVILCPDNKARPIWRYIGGRNIALEAGMSPENWSLRAAEAAEGHPALEEVMRAFTIEQACEVFRSMTSKELDEATGREYIGTACRVMGEEVLKRFHNRLVKRGVPVEPISAIDDGPCEWPHAELDSIKLTAKDGWSLPISCCGPLQEDVRKGMEQLGYEMLYLHQALALKQLARNPPFDVVLTTPTASGKTMAFLPGIFSDLAVNNGNALFLYPLRALCTDQVDKIRGLLKAMNRSEDELYPFYYQAVLPKDAPRLIAATPDKINVHLDKNVIRHFLNGLRWIVIDEAHTYKGCFGINVAFLLRRLLSFAPSDTRLVLSSATLDNTVAFARNLTGRHNFRVISGSAAPRHARYYYLARPESKALLRVIVDRVLENNSKGLIFVRGRGETQQRATELERGAGKTVVFPFYSGVQDHSQRLNRLKGKGVAVAVATSSLEAGVDIADVTDLAICGFPRNRGSFIQMAGRAGRQRTGQIVFIPASSPADEFYSHAAAFQELINGDAEPIYLNPFNRPLMEVHLKRFAREAPNKDRAALLDAFLPPDDGTHQELRSALESMLAECRDVGVPPAPPSLRAIPGDTHVILKTGEDGSPLPPLDHLKRSDAEERDCLIEVAIQENARREWPPESIATRDGRYYAIERWDRGKWIEDQGEAGRAADAVFIWVRDVTGDMIGPDDYRRALSGETVLPEGKEAAHYHQAVLDTIGQIEYVTNRDCVKCLNVEAGRGTVNVAVQNYRLRWQLEVRYRCPRWSSKSHGEKTMRTAADSVEWFLDGQPIDPPRSDNGESLVAMRSFEVELDGRIRRFRVIGRGVVAGTLRIDLEEHVFDSARRHPCSCGSALVLDCHWVRTTEEAPPSWWTHPTYLTDRRFESDLAIVRFPKAAPGAILALAYALVKVMPNVMFLDPGDVGAALILVEGGIALLLYDVIEGGSGICTSIPAKFVELVSATEQLLTRCPDCPYCQGTGCFGCLQPREPLDWPRPESPPEGEGQQDTKYTPWPVGALAILAGQPAENNSAQEDTP